MTPACLLVIQHEPEAPIAWLGQWWAERGIDVDVCRGDLDHPIPAHLDPQVHAGLVVLGGYMGANDDDEHAWLTPTKALIRESIAAGIPFLGICLGHQLASVALGGLVGRNPAGRSLGAHPVLLTAAGESDPLLHGPNRRLAVHYNDDIVLQAPPDATVLAHGRGGEILALRFGPRAWGLQFHPETSPEVFATWATESDGAAFATALAEVIDQRDHLERSWRVLAERFPSPLTA